MILQVAMGGVTTDVIVNDADLRAHANDAMREVVAIANADLREHGVLDFLDEKAVMERMFGLTDNMGPYWTSTAIDLRENRQLELDYLFSAPLQRATDLHVPCPALTSIIRFIRGQARKRDRK
mmetsp:Transcript_82930/g.222462  ORF Transcript_82930/g.222462 Transcript_82930/m.222462 type:complete len:123 (+) Transcript_82930:779-1147(+)